MTRFIDVATMADLVAECGLETFLGDLLFKLGNYFCAVRRSTAGTAADKNV